MKLLLYKPLYYNLNECANDINFFPDEGIINDAINSFFLAKTPTSFIWLETLRRWRNRREFFVDCHPTCWSLSNPKKEVFKELKVVSV